VVKSSPNMSRQISEIDIAKYLKRINFQGQPEVNLAVLSRLQKLHLSNIPFENLDIHTGTKIELDIAKIFSKIVENGRGGFCYELNGLFYELLMAIGFNAKMVSGRVYGRDGNYGKEFDHLAIIVEIDEREYLVDVGFGKFSLEPLEMKLDVILHDELGEFQFDKFDENYWRINEIVNGELVPEYIFKLQPRDFSEFVPMCEFHQTSPESHFTRGKLISKIVDGGRITLTNKQLKITNGNQTETIEFADDEFVGYLKKHFDIEL
jgi:N-hydroxyarylamine O-acetyltransferase